MGRCPIGCNAVQDPLIGLGVFGQRIKVGVGVFTVNHARVCVSVIGGDDDQGVFVFFGKVDGYFYGIVKGNLVVQKRGYVVGVGGPVNFPGLDLHDKSLFMVLHPADGFCSHLGQRRECFLQLPACVPINGVGKGILAKNAQQRLAYGRIHQFAAAFAYGPAFVGERLIQISLVFAFVG